MTGRSRLSGVQRWAIRTCSSDKSPIFSNRRARGMKYAKDVLLATLRNAAHRAGLLHRRRYEPVDGALQLHMKGNDRLVPRIVTAAERGGFSILDFSIAEPSLEAVFINLTGKELRD